MRKTIIGIAIFVFCLEIIAAQDTNKLQFYSSLDSCLVLNKQELLKVSDESDWMEHKCRCRFKSDTLVKLQDFKMDSILLLYKGEKLLYKNSNEVVRNWDLIVKNKLLGEAQMIFIAQMNIWTVTFRILEKVSTTEVLDGNIQFTDRFVLADNQWKLTKVADKKTRSSRSLVTEIERKIYQDGTIIVFYEVYDTNLLIIELIKDQRSLGAIVCSESNY